MLDRPAGLHDASRNDVHGPPAVMLPATEPVVSMTRDVMCPIMGSHMVIAICPRAKYVYSLDYSGSALGSEFQGTSA